MEWFLFAILLGAGGGAWLVRRRRARAWRKIAREFGLEFSEPGLFAGPRISGPKDDMFIDVRPVNQNKTSFVQVMIQHRTGPTEFTITRATRLGTSIRRTDPEAMFESMTGTDIEIGLADFDDLATIHGSRVPLQAYLTPEKIQKIRYLLETFPGARITQSELRLRIKAGRQEEERLGEMLHEAIAAASILRPQRGKPQPPTDGPPPAENVEEGKPSPAPTRPGHHTAGGKAARPAVAPSLARLTDAQTMSEELFEGGAVSYETERRFRDLYAGRLVRWSGYLVETRPHQAVVRVAEMPDPLFGRSPILVVTDTPAPSDLVVGDWVTADGIAFRLDHLERTVYLREGVVFA